MGDVIAEAIRTAETMSQFAIRYLSALVSVRSSRSIVTPPKAMLVSHPNTLSPAEPKSYVQLMSRSSSGARFRFLSRSISGS
jgi:hypothetical protein